MLIYFKAMIIITELCHFGISPATHDIFDKAYQDLISLATMLRKYFHIHDIPVINEPEVENTLAMTPMFGEHRPIA